MSFATQSSPVIALRPATLDDVKALAELASDTFCETFGHNYKPQDLQAHLDGKCSEDFFREALTDGQSHTVIAWDGSRAVGYVKWGALELPAVDAPAGSAEIHRLYVHSTHQASGLGRRLMEHALEACNGASAIYLGVWEHNPKAQRFYRSYGFTDAGEHVYLVGDQPDRDLIWVRRG